MKKQLFSLMVSVAGFATTPAFCMEEVVEDKSKKVAFSLHVPFDCMERHVLPSLDPTDIKNLAYVSKDFRNYFKEKCYYKK